MKNDIIKIKVGILVENKNRLLLIKESNDPDDKYYWNIIKGSFEPDKDKDFFESAKRECEEEAGIKVKLTHLLNVMYLNKRDMYIIQFNFIALIQKGVPKVAKINHQKMRNEDITELKFFTKSELKKMKKQEFINERAFLAVNEWLKNKRNNLKIFKFIN
jgi:ADP-ribose pyrophosphatase YjhB (NUDIX family)